jgi:hypothetical protein
MKTNLQISGKIMTLLSKTHDNKVTHYAQFLSESESKGMEILKVKLSDSIGRLEKGQAVTIPVKIACVNNTLFYSQDGDIITHPNANNKA